ncbi:MAG TPA: ABC transporter ATP-binding protein [Gammaproteobacteria bacterium]|nr:ABC transporter ATP-binding protein [Gammaproteobacteria bacterium]
MNALLEVRSLQVRLPTGGELCRDLFLQVGKGQCWGVLGPNGVGKTTLLHTLAGLSAPAGGEVLLEGCRMDELPRRHVARRVGVLFQEQRDPFPGTVLEAALVGRHPHLGRWQWEGAEDLKLARNMLALVELEGLAERQLATLSGGERQRLAIATLLVQQPRLMLLDEPTNHLDVRHRMQVMELLRATLQRGAAVVMVLHDINLALRYCDHLLLLFPGGGVEQGGCEQILDGRLLERLYGYPMRRVAGPHGALYVPD